jgi:hypothetical protein
VGILKRERDVMDLKSGMRIRYTVDGLGCVRSDHTVNAGDIGIYQGPAPQLAGSEGDSGWHITVVTLSVEGGTEVLACPVAEDMFEPADD